MAVLPHAGVPAAAAGGAPLRVGVVGGLGFDAAGLSRTTRARWDRPAVPVAFPGWGSLADHAAAIGEGLIDAAVLPCEGDEAPVLVPPGLRALLLLRSARPRRLGIGLRHPQSEAALRGLLPDGLRPTLLAMPPAMLVGNLKAGVIDAALLLGADALAADEATAGLTALPLGPELATAVLPRLAIRLRAGSWGAPSA